MANSSFTFGNLDVIPKTLIDAKGDLIVGSAADLVERLAAGANDEVPIYDSAQSGGLKKGKIANAQVDTAAAIARTKLATATRKIQPPVISPNLGEAYWNNVSLQSVIVPFAIPDDYVSGDLTFNWFRRGGSATGTESASYGEDDTQVFQTAVGSP